MSSAPEPQPHGASDSPARAGDTLPKEGFSFSGERQRSTRQSRSSKTDATSGTSRSLSSSSSSSRRGSRSSSGRDGSRSSSRRRRKARIGIFLGVLYFTVTAGFIGMAVINYQRKAEVADKASQKEETRRTLEGRNPAPDTQAALQPITDDQRLLTEARNRYLLREGRSEPDEETAVNGTSEAPVPKLDNEQEVEIQRRELLDKLLPYSDTARSEQRAREVAPDNLYMDLPGIEKPAEKDKKSKKEGVTTSP